MMPLNSASQQQTHEILALGELLGQYDGPRLAMETLRRGGGKQEFMKRVAEKARDEPMFAAANRLLGIDSGQRDLSGFSLCKQLRAQMDTRWQDAGLERSVSDLVTTKSGRAPMGAWVPLPLLARNFDAGGATEAGSLIGAPVFSELAPDPVRAVTAVARLGATMLSGLKGDITIPQFKTSTSAGWTTETGSATAQTMTTGSLDLAAKRVAASITFSRQALLQATPELDAAMSRIILQALMSKFEHGALNGDGTANDPVGIRATSGVGAVVGGTNGATLTWAHLCDLEDTPADADVVESRAGFIVNAPTRRFLRSTVRAAGLPFVWDGGPRPLLGYAAGVTSNLPSNLEKGTSGPVCSSLVYGADWSQLVMAVYGGGADLTLDRVTLADQGKVKITANLYCNAGPALPAAFAKIDDAKLS